MNSLIETLQDEPGPGFDTQTQSEDFEISDPPHSQ